MGFSREQIDHRGGVSIVLIQRCQALRRANVFPYSVVDAAFDLAAVGRSTHQGHDGKAAAPRISKKLRPVKRDATISQILIV